MDSEKLAALFSDDDDEFLHFERIPEGERLHPSACVCGMMKVASLLKKGPKSFDVCAEHDCVYLAQADDLRNITQEDAVYLSRCGVALSSDTDSLYMFC